MTCVRYIFQPPPLPVSPPPPEVDDNDVADRITANNDVDFDARHEATRADEEIAFDNDVIRPESSADVSATSPRSPRFDLDSFNFAGGGAGGESRVDSEPTSPELDPQVLFMRLKEVLACSSLSVVYCM